MHIINSWGRHTGLIYSDPAPHRVRASAVLFARRQPRASVDYGAGIVWDGSVALRNAGDNGIGDCVPVAALQLARVRQRVCAGSTWTPTDAMAEALYRAWAGWDGTASTDLGTDPHEAMDRWATTGLRVNPQLLDIGPWVAPEASLDALRAAVDFGVGALATVALRESDFDVTKPWAVTQDQSIGPHEVFVVGYDGDKFKVITWDYEVEVPNAAMQQRLLAVQSPISRLVIETTGLSPDGMTWEELQQQLAA